MVTPHTKSVIMADIPNISLSTYDKYENKRIKNTSLGGDSLKLVKKLEIAAEISPNPIPKRMLRIEIYTKFQTVLPIKVPLIGRSFSSFDPSELLIISATA